MFRRELETISNILGSSSSGVMTRSDEMYTSKQFGASKRHDTFRLEPSDGLMLPHVVIPAQKDEEDFFATIATYYQEYSPISALIHVLGKETSRLFDYPQEALSFSFSTSDAQSKRLFRMACLGASIGEAAIYGLSVGELEIGLTYSSCRRTLAFNLCRATILYPSTLRANIITERWVKLRKLSGLNISTVVVDAVNLVHSLASGTTFRQNSLQIDSDITEILIKTCLGEDIDGRQFETLVSSRYSDSKGLFEDLRGAFDNRMSIFIQLVKSIQSSSLGTKNDEIVVAFACNRIQPGSFAHAAVLAKLIEFFPASLVWYGFFAALSKQAPTSYLNPKLMSKLERDLLEAFSFEQRPSCDISIDELEVLSRVDQRADISRINQQRGLLVSLLPGVNVYSKYGRGGEGEHREIERREAEAVESNARAIRLLEEALYTLKRADRAAEAEPAKRRHRKDK